MQAGRRKQYSPPCPYIRQFQHYVGLPFFYLYFLTIVKLVNDTITGTDITSTMSILNARDNDVILVNINFEIGPIRNYTVLQRIHTR